MLSGNILKLSQWVGGEKGCRPSVTPPWAKIEGPALELVGGVAEMILAAFPCRFPILGTVQKVAESLVSVRALYPCGSSWAEQAKKGLQKFVSLPISKEDWEGVVLRVAAAAGAVLLKTLHIGVLAPAAGLCPPPSFTKKVSVSLAVVSVVEHALRLRSWYHLVLQDSHDPAPRWMKPAESFVWIAHGCCVLSGDRVPWLRTASAAAGAAIALRRAYYSNITK